MNDLQILGGVSSHERGSRFDGDGQHCPDPFARRNDHQRRLHESLLEEVFAAARWRQLECEGVTPDRLVAFHSNHKYQLMAHSPHQLTVLGRLVARCGVGDVVATGHAYRDSFMAAMRCRATPGMHVNVLQHMAGYLRGAASVGARRQVNEAIADYRHGITPRSVPVALLRHHLREHDISYLARQSYFYPFPKDLVRS